MAHLIHLIDGPAPIYSTKYLILGLISLLIRSPKPAHVDTTTSLSCSIPTSSTQHSGVPELSNSSMTIFFFRRFTSGWVVLTPASPVLAPAYMLPTHQVVFVFAPTPPHASFFQ